MPINARAQVILERDGLLPEDVSVNTWHFQGDVAVGETTSERFDEDAPGLADRLEAFYVSLQTFFAVTCTGNARIKLYNMADPRPRVPHSEYTFTFVPGTAAYPSEVAICLSFKGEVVSGQSMRRRRGRIYLGPINSQMGLIDGSDVRINFSNAPAIITAAEALQTGGTGAFRHAIYSRTQDGPTEPQSDAAWTDVDSYWVDNAFDTQRRRGAKATARFT